MARRIKRQLKNEINVVPYIDVMLVLLIIFMITAPMINPAQIELPQIGKSSSAPSDIGGLKLPRRELLLPRPIHAS